MNKYITTITRLALQEDIGSGDITANLIDENLTATAEIRTRHMGIFCGSLYADAILAHFNPVPDIVWQVKDGDLIQPDQVLCHLFGNARILLTLERTLLNFLQTLSGTATRAGYFSHLIKDTNAVLLDTRKTIPGLRVAQKYAVKIGGGENHRQGLFDAFLIKENHIAAAGSIANAMSACQKVAANKKIIIEVENLEELSQALEAGAQHIMLDNFDLATIQAAVGMRPAGVKLEASGGIDANNILEIALTGVDYISLGTLTKDLMAIDLSMRLTLQ